MKCATGLLNEMSLQELQERLRINKIRDKEKEEAAREKFRQQKIDKVAELRRKMDNVAQIRALAQQANQQRRARSAMTAEEREKQQRKEAESRNRTLVSRLRTMRTARHEEQAKLDADCAAVAKARLLLGAGHDQRERQYYRDKMDGLEREARLRQQNAKREQTRYEEGKTLARVCYGRICWFFVLQQLTVRVFRNKRCNSKKVKTANGKTLKGDDCSKWRLHPNTCQTNST